MIKGLTYVYSKSNIAIVLYRILHNYTFNAINLLEVPYG